MLVSIIVACLEKRKRTLGDMSHMRFFTMESKPTHKQDQEGSACKGFAILSNNTKIKKDAYVKR